MGYNVARNPMGMVPNALLASALGKEIHPPILITIKIHRGHVNRDIRDEQEIAHNILSRFPCYSL